MVAVIGYFMTSSWILTEGHRRTKDKMWVIHRTGIPFSYLSNERSPGKFCVWWSKMSCLVELLWFIVYIKTHTRVSVNWRILAFLQSENWFCCCGKTLENYDLPTAGTNK